MTVKHYCDECKKEITGQGVLLTNLRLYGVDISQLLVGGVELCSLDCVVNFCKKNVNKIWFEGSKHDR